MLIWIGKRILDVTRRILERVGTRQLIGTDQVGITGFAQTRAIRHQFVGLYGGHMLNHDHQQLALRDDQDGDETARFVVPGRVGFEVGETDLLKPHLPEQPAQGVSLYGAR